MDVDSAMLYGFRQIHLNIYLIAYIRETHLWYSLYVSTHKHLFVPRLINTFQRNILPPPTSVRLPWEWKLLLDLICSHNRFVRLHLISYYTKYRSSRNSCF